MAEKFTNLHFVEFCKQFIGRPYWYGTCIYPCTTSLLNSKKSQYSSHYTSDRMTKYKEAIAKHEICSDCVGLIKGYAWTNGGEGVIESIGRETPLFTNKYGSNGMPDQSANGMFEYAKKKGLDWGTISTIPEIPGIAVRRDGHVGVYIGNGKVVEEKGFAYGCVMTNLKSSTWLHWYKIPTINYVSGQTTTNTETSYKLGDRVLRKGSKGEDVKELQTDLNTILKTQLEVDGDFGNLTQQAVINFQNRAQITANGIYDEKTHNALMNMLADRNPDTTEEKAEQDKKINLITLGSVNIRSGNSTAYSILTTISKGTKLTPILTAENKVIVSANNWYAVEAANQIGWISGKYVQINS